jgi:hypothetical protein
MEAAFYKSDEPDETKSGRTAGVEVSDEPTRTVVEWRSLTNERGIPEGLL